MADSSVVFSTGTLPLNAPEPPVRNAGNRMMWYAEKAAFRAGGVSGGEWNGLLVGRYSVALGYSNTATAMSSIALGEGNFAAGLASLALGYQSSANNDRSIAIGSGVTATGFGSFACGSETNSTGDYSFVSGIGTRAKAFAGSAMGMYNNVSDIPDISAAAASDRIFQVGNGSAVNMRSNAITILRNGNTGIGTLTPVTRLDVAGGNNWNLAGSEGDFRIGNSDYRIKMGIALDGGGAGAATIHAAGGIERLNLGANNTNIITMNGGSGFVGIGTENPTQKLQVAGNILATGTITPSDRRFKEDIQLIPDPLEKIQQINGVTYHYKKNEFPANGFDDKEQVGVIAQEVEVVLPQIVYTDDKGYKAVDYSKLVPLLIESIKAQQKQIDNLSRELSSLKKERQ